MMREYVHPIADDDPLRLLVDLLALRLVRRRAGLFKELVDLGLRVPAVVEAATGVPEGEHVAVRIDAPGPARQRRIELVLDASLERELGEVLGQEVDRDTGLGQLCLNELTGLDRILGIGGL